MLERVYIQMKWGISAFNSDIGFDFGCSVWSSCSLSSNCDRQTYIVGQT